MSRILSTGGGVCQTPSGQTRQTPTHPTPRQTRPWADIPPSQETATATDGTHPTGMHSVSCYFYELLFLDLSGFLIQTVFCRVTHQILHPIETLDTFLECVAYHFIQFVSLCTQPHVQKIFCLKTMRSLTRRPM